mmetsp:Transcript_18432/g.23979  ORF Transcript_18432/g.23979 Transcript_18432/m.23979 type:complete len:91 (+) Transcript_18432:195-467(+)
MALWNIALPDFFSPVQPKVHICGNSGHALMQELYKKKKNANLSKHVTKNLRPTMQSFERIKSQMEIDNWASIEQLDAAKAAGHQINHHQS